MNQTAAIQSAAVETLHPVLRNFISALPAQPAQRKPAKVWPSMPANADEIAMHNQFVSLFNADRKGA